MKFKRTTEAASETIRLMADLCENEPVLAEIEKIADSIAAALQQGGKVLICGNGGSGCDASHFAEEFTGRFRKDRRALPAIALMDGHTSPVLRTTLVTTLFFPDRWRRWERREMY